MFSLMFVCSQGRWLPRCITGHMIKEFCISCLHPGDVCICRGASGMMGSALGGCIWGDRVCIGGNGIWADGSLHPGVCILMVYPGVFADPGYTWDIVNKLVVSILLEECFLGSNICSWRDQ